MLTGKDLFLCLDLFVLFLLFSFLSIFSFVTDKQFQVSNKPMEQLVITVTKKGQDSMTKALLVVSFNLLGIDCEDKIMANGGSHHGE